jgi:hypothetical protein
MAALSLSALPGKGENFQVVGDKVSAVNGLADYFGYEISHMLVAGCSPGVFPSVAISTKHQASPEETIA